jgi:hypothetical protein
MCYVAKYHSNFQKYPGYGRMVQASDHAVGEALDLAASSGGHCVGCAFFFIKRNGWGIL